MIRALQIKTCTCPAREVLRSSRCETLPCRTVATVGTKPRDALDNKVQEHTKDSLHRNVQQSILPPSLPASSVTSWISNLVSNTSIRDLSDRTVHRSKRMLLDTLGVGILGHDTRISQSVIKTYLETERPVEGNRCGGGATVWGSEGLKTSAATAAFINGVSVHSMDFDDTWHPPTHPSGPTLPAVMALAESMTGDMSPSLEDVLVAYNVGVQVQGLLLRSAVSATEIPSRFHPPAVVGVMGSAAACANLLGFSPTKSRNALGIAASFAGAPMANAGTTTKPLHAGKAARFGLEAALFADRGLEGNHDILDLPSGFGAFYEDFDPNALLKVFGDSQEFLLHHQDIALKRFPAHLGMHWAIEATLAARADAIRDKAASLDANTVRDVLIRAPKSKYINRPLPSTAHEARHSFQFNTCTALLDGEVTPNSFTLSERRRPALLTLLQKTRVETPDDNIASFSDMYVEVVLTMRDGSEVVQRCETPYCHWRNPLSDQDVENKFKRNASKMSPTQRTDLVETVKQANSTIPASTLTDLVYVKE